MISLLGKTTSFKSVCEMQLLHTPATKFPSQFASPKPKTKKAYMSGCDFCTSNVVKKGNTSLKKQNKTKNKTTTPKSKVVLSPQKTPVKFTGKRIVLIAKQYPIKAISKEDTDKNI